MARKLKMEELNRMTAGEFREAKKFPIVGVLDNIRSMNNIGSFFRTADAFRLQELILCGITATPPHRDIHKTALGATESMAWRYFPTTLEAVERLRKEGFQIISVEQAEESRKLNEDFELKPPIALIFGNEVDGVEQEAIDRSDFCVEIPQYGAKHSLNVTVCAGIVIWEIFKRLS